MGGEWTFSHHFSSTLTVWERECFEDIFTKDHWLTDWINDKVVSRMTPGTPGLLKNTMTTKLTWPLKNQDHLKYHDHIKCNG